LISQVQLAAKYGLSPDAALRALTINPAEVFGVVDEVGSRGTPSLQAAGQNGYHRWKDVLK
jgi:adenine deaminase